MFVEEVANWIKGYPLFIDRVLFIYVKSHDREDERKAYLLVWRLQLPKSKHMVHDKR